MHLAPISGTSTVTVAITNILSAESESTLPRRSKSWKLSWPTSTENQNDRI